jgi:hypothetical protein
MPASTTVACASAEPEFLETYSSEKEAQNKILSRIRNEWTRSTIIEET